MKRSWKIFFLFVIVILGIALFVHHESIPNISPVPTPSEPTISSTPELAKVNFPLQLPEGFQISLFAKNLPNARVEAFDARGNLWVSRTKSGVVSMLDIENGVVVGQKDIFKNLKNPHGLAFDPKFPNVLFIAEEDKLIRAEIYRDAPAFEKGKVSDIDAVIMTLETTQFAPYGVLKVLDLPGAGRHFTRTLQFDTAGNLFVSIGSTCDVCHERDSRISTVMKVVFDDEYHTKAHLAPYSTGLRNSVFMAIQPTTGNMWATDMGRDYLGDNIPPDEVNIVAENKNYGWPNCYGKNIHDTVFDKNIYIRNPCLEPFETPSYIDLPAHSAALGLAFVPENSNWPKEYWNNLLIAYHGSTNRSVLTGYKIVRYPLNADGKPATGDSFVEQDFISGWLHSGKQSYGRPVDLVFDKDANLYISDDKLGVIYKVVSL